MCVAVGESIRSELSSRRRRRGVDSSSEGRGVCSFEVASGESEAGVDVENGDDEMPDS